MLTHPEDMCSWASQFVCQELTRRLGFIRYGSEELDIRTDSYTRNN